MRGADVSLLAATAALTLGLTASCSFRSSALRPVDAPGETPSSGETVAGSKSTAIAADGRFVSWREHLVDGADAPEGAPLEGGDGLELHDLDGDGLDDVVAVYESDVRYGTRDGHVRASFRSADSHGWLNVSLAHGADAAGAEDVAVGDINGDGWADVLVACELGHLLYLQNPTGEAARNQVWPRLILPMTAGRGSFVRVAVADLDADGRLEVIGVNKGVQNPSGHEPPTPVSVFSTTGDPLSATGWHEREIVRLRVPINAEPVDLDQDGDVDLVLGSRGDRGLFLQRNMGIMREGGADFLASGPLALESADGGGEPPGMSDGSHLKFEDLDGDNRLDVVLRMYQPGPEGLYYTVGWLQQPTSLDQPWTYHPIGSLYPDVAAGMALADVDGDGDTDLMTGGYSGLDIVRGGYSGDPRDRDGANVQINSSVGRIAWFANPGDPTGSWMRHDVSRRVRALFDEFLPVDLNDDGLVDFLGTRGNSGELDGLFWLEQRRADVAERRFHGARENDSRQLPLPTVDKPRRNDSTGQSLQGVQ